MTLFNSVSLIYHQLFACLGHLRICTLAVPVAVWVATAFVNLGMKSVVGLCPTPLSSGSAAQQHLSPWTWARWLLQSLRSWRDMVERVEHPWGSRGLGPLPYPATFHMELNRAKPVHSCYSRVKFCVQQMSWEGSVEMCSPALSAWTQKIDADILSAYVAFDHCWCIIALEKDHAISHGAEIVNKEFNGLIAPKLQKCWLQNKKVQ